MHKITYNYLFHKTCFLSEFEPPTEQATKHTKKTIHAMLVLVNYFLSVTLSLEKNGFVTFSERELTQI